MTGSGSESFAASQLMFYANATHDGVICVNAKGIVMDWNAGATQLFGCDESKAKGLPIWQFVPDIVEPEKYWELHRQAGGRVQQVVGTGSGGSPLVLSLSLGSWGPSGARVFGLLVQDENGQVDAQANWERLAKSSSDLLLLLQWDGTIDYMSRNVPGLTMAEAPGTSVLDYLIWDGILPQNRAELEQGLVQLFEKAKPYTYESWGILDDGSQAWYWCRLTPQMVQGKVTRATLTISDVTERHQRDAALQRLGMIIKSTHDAVISTDKEGLINTWNDGAHRLFGHRPTEALGQPLRELLPTEKVEDQALFEQRLLHLGERQAWEGVHRARSGSPIPVSITLARLNTQDGEFGGLSAVVRDASAQKNLENALRAAKDAAENASRAKSDFLANMSHEIRTPMNGVTGMAEILLGTELTREQQDYVETLQSACDSLRSVIDDILDVSKLEAGRLRIERIAFDPIKLVRESVAIFAHAITQAGVEVISEIGENLPEAVEGDPHRIRQILNNLIGNAKKFTKQGTITVRLTQASDSGADCRLRFEVIDTGVGIAPQVQEHIFSPFGQADTSITRKFGGTGLGLTICRQLAELMNGEIGVISELGQGACFWFEMSLPVGQQITSVSLRPECLRPATPRPDIPVLLAEDNLINQKVAKTMLKRMGCEVTIAKNGRLAVEYCALQKFAMIFMDCQMPEVSGYEATGQIRAAGNGIPIVAMTAQALEGDRQACLDAGMDDYITKPISQKSLKAMLDKWSGEVASSKATA